MVQARIAPLQVLPSQKAILPGVFIVQLEAKSKVLIVPSLLKSTWELMPVVLLKLESRIERSTNSTLPSPLASPLLLAGVAVGWAIGVLVMAGVTPGVA